MTTTVNDIEHIESQSLRGVGGRQDLLPARRQDRSGDRPDHVDLADGAPSGMPPGTNPPFIITYNASSVPVLQLALSGKGLSEQQLYDLGVNFLRVQLATVQGASIPNRLRRQAARRSRSTSTRRRCRRRGCRRPTSSTRSAAQNLILPGGTSKIGGTEYDVG